MKPALSLLIVAGLAFSQTAFDPRNPDREKGFPNAKGLSERLAASEYVVIGTVTRLENVVSKEYAAQRAEYLRPENAGKGLPLTVYSPLAFLHAVRVDATLCRRSDFQESSARMPEPREIYIFSFARWSTDQLYRDENLREGSRYLFSIGQDLSVPDKIADYEIDPGRSYYQVLHHSDGAIELPPEHAKRGTFRPVGYKSDKDLVTPVLKAATALCAAVQPAEMSEKLHALQKLRSSRDRVMRENADAAIRVLDSNRRR